LNDMIKLLITRLRKTRFQAA
jgi:hypothetical protein